jgi:hypothetical protein
MRIGPMTRKKNMGISVRKNMGISYDLIKSFNYPHRKPHDLI